ncbi:MAG: PadR family transcriptional regulator [Peptococcaceae bacterium]|nr:PadR family transcriptional regulator [Peptococcaceae bacterium]
MSERKKAHASRHAPAFILLFLARGANYGAALLAQMEQEMPHFLGDSAMIYRTLRDLENQECLKTSWQTEGSGPPKKIYQITPKGWLRLTEFKQDILKRQENFSYFLSSFQAIQHSEQPQTGEELR